MNLVRTLGTGAALAAAALVIATPMASADQQPSSTVTVSPTPAPGPPSTAATKPKAPAPQVRELPKGAPETGGGPEDTSGVALWVVGAAGAATVGAGGMLALRRRRVTN
ncbi:hypothetical protein [Actinokineospora sp. HUAS TT18]|uniref:hypothetical protein n=1 Tax=Actinokineospora sp. HUAS TT18 TaxID=3447451 RepID=UPI003F52523D